MIFELKVYVVYDVRLKGCSVKTNLSIAFVKCTETVVRRVLGWTMSMSSIIL